MSAVEYWRCVEGNRASHCTTQPEEDVEGRVSTLIPALLFDPQLQGTLTHCKGWVLRSHTGPTAGECASSNKSGSRWNASPRENMSASVGNNGMFLKRVDPDSGDHRAEIRAWSCEPMDSLGKLSLISTLDLLALLGKDHSAAQLGLTTQHTEYCNAMGKHYATFNCHAIIFPETCFSHWEKSCSYPVCTGEGWQQ